MRYAINCEEITVYSFYAILEKNDFRFIVMDWDGYTDIKIDEEKAKLLWREIYNEYCKLTQDNKTLMYFELTCELVYLENRIFVCTQLVDRLEQRKDQPEAIMIYSDALNKWRFKVNPENDIDLEIQNVRNNLKVAENRIRLKYDELESLRSETGDEPMSLARQLIKMEQVLNRNEINPKTTSMFRFIEMLNEIKEINAIRSKQYGSGLSTVD